MAESSWPKDGDPVYADRWSVMARGFQASGVVGTVRDATDPALKPRLAGGRTFGAAVGDAYVAGAQYRNDADLVTAETPVNAGSSTRTDLLVLRHGPTPGAVVSLVLEGTPGGGPPAVTRTDTVYDLVIAAADAAPSASAYTNLQDRRQFAGGNVVVAPTDADLLALAAGDLLVRPDRRDLAYWDGTELRGLSVAGPYDDLNTVIGVSVNNFGSRTVGTLAIPDPGWPYVIECHGQVELKSNHGGTRPDVEVRVGSSGPRVATGAGMDLQSYHTATIVPDRASAQPQTGGKTLYVVAIRQFGSGSYNVTELRAALSATLHPA